MEPRRTRIQSRKRKPGADEISAAYFGFSAVVPYANLIWIRTWAVGASVVRRSVSGSGSAGRSGWAVKSPRSAGGSSGRVRLYCLPGLLGRDPARRGRSLAWGAGPLGPADGCGVQGPPSAPGVSFRSIRQKCEGPSCRGAVSGRRSAGHCRVRFMGTSWAAETGTNAPLCVFLGYVAGGENGDECAVVGDLWARWHSVDGSPAVQVGPTVPLWAISGMFAP